MANLLTPILTVLPRALLTSLFAFAILSWFSVDASFAHRPDRCFHTHNGGNTKCKSRVPGKSCSDEDGNKGICRQGGRYCYCSIHKKSNDSARRLLDLGIGIGGAILEDRLNRGNDDENQDYDRKSDQENDWEENREERRRE